MSSICRTKSVLLTTTSARSGSSNVKPAPSAPGIATTAILATWVSNSSSPPWPSVNRDSADNDDAKSASWASNTA